MRAWLDSVLGPATGEQPEMARHKKVILLPVLSVMTNLSQWQGEIEV